MTLLAVPRCPDFKQASKKAKLSAKLPNTFPSTALSSFICDVMLLRARRSSVWTRPCSCTRMASDLKSRSLRTSLTN